MAFEDSTPPPSPPPKQTSPPTTPGQPTNNDNNNVIQSNSSRRVPSHPNARPTNQTLAPHGLNKNFHGHGSSLSPLSHQASSQSISDSSDIYPGMYSTVMNQSSPISGPSSLSSSTFSSSSTYMRGTYDSSASATMSQYPFHRPINSSLPHAIVDDDPQMIIPPARHYVDSFRDTDNLTPVQNEDGYAHIGNGVLAGNASYRAIQKQADVAQTVQTFPPNPSSNSSVIANNQMTIGKCMCCDSNLRFPITVSCFRCTVCMTINDQKPAQCRREGDPLTLTRLKEAIEENHSADPTEDGAQENSNRKGLLEILVAQTFSNMEILNESFPNGKPVMLEDCGVDLAAVRESYLLLLDMPVNIIKILMKSTESLLKRPGKPAKRKEDIRCFMIILENPLLSQHNYPQESQFHHNIIKRIFGLLSNLSNELHHYLVNWFARLPTSIFRRRVDLVNSFITYRLAKQQRSSSGRAAYESDWRIKSAARVMALLFAANNQRPRVQISEFYNTMVDYIDLIRDFDSWEQRAGKFSFCQYPFLLSMGAKISIMEYDARRQMDGKAREALFSILFQKRPIQPHLVLHIRRDYLIEDSLRQISSNEMELKKSLRIEFVGEDGVDAGGLRKEWFLLLVRELFDPQYGMFTWEEDSNLCWFNPASFETSDQYFLVGTVLGLAIYNSTILDIHLPLAVYKKLLGIPVGLEDLRVLRPTFARGLEQLLKFEGNVKETFCRDFVAEYEAFGEVQRIPLCPGGEEKPVSNENRQEYVEKYCNFILNDSVAKQFEPFKRGFYNVCGGNALSLFRPEEIELLVRGSAEQLDVEQLRAVTVYEGFIESEDTIRNFWSIFKSMDGERQRRLLTFVTGSDRIPATGAANLAWKISCIGEDCERFPIAHTCFNQLCLYRYKGRTKLENKLIRAIQETEGFDLK